MFLQQPQGKIREVRTRDAAVGRRDTTTTWTKVKLTRLPRQDVIRDASTSGDAERHTRPGVLDHLVGDTWMEKEEGCSVLGSAPLVPVGHNKDTEAPEPWRAETKSSS